MKHPTFPGDILTVEEEYAPGINTLTDDEGNVLSTVVGDADFDEDAREVHVTPSPRQKRVIEVGSIVVGRVSLVKNAVVLLSLGYATKDGRTQRLTDATAALNIARVSKEFIRSLSDYFKIGDFVRAKVVGVTAYSIEVSTADPGLGVIMPRAQVVSTLIQGPETLPEPSKERSE